MADLSDVTAYLAQQANAAVYPNGTGAASVAAMDVRIFEGWPIPDQLDLDMQGKMKDATTGAVVPRPAGAVANVSVFPLLGTGVQVYQILDETYTITPPAPAMTVSVSGNVITVSGQPVAGEYLTLVCDNAHVYSRSGATTAAILAALATDAQANYPTASATATTLTVPVQAYLTVRQGAPAVSGKVTHRQMHSIMLTVWAPNRVVRTTLAAAIDNLIKQNIRVSMPDTSQAKVIYNRTMVNDEQQSEGIYRRDLVFDVEYATVQQFTSYPVTSVQTSITNPSNNPIATATT